MTVSAMRRAPSAAPLRAGSRAGPVRQAADPDHPVRDDRRSADLCALDRQLPPQLAQRPARRRAHRGAGARRRAERHGAGDAGAAVLDSIGARAVAMKMGNTAPPARRLRHAAGGASRHRHARTCPWHRAIADAFEHAAVQRQRRDARGRPGADAAAISSRSCWTRRRCAQAMLRFSVNILLLSLVISGDHRGAGLFRAALPAGAADAPHHRQHDGVSRRPGKSRRASSRRRRAQDEVGLAERELAAMQGDLASMLQQKSRLAALGLAVSKINHDLRNLLASAQLFSEGLSHLPDPRVQRFAPKLMRALERAIAFCQSTLSYGRVAGAAAGRAGRSSSSALVEEVRETLGARRRRADRLDRRDRARPEGRRRPRPAAARAAQSGAQRRSRRWRARAPNDPLRDQIRITGRREGAVAVIEVSDTGPGFPAKGREHLFEAFQGSTRTGGTGPRPRHRRRTGPRPRRRDRAGRGHHRRDLPPHHSRTARWSSTPTAARGGRIAGPVIPGRGLRAFARSTRGREPESETSNLPSGSCFARPGMTCPKPLPKGADPIAIRRSAPLARFRRIFIGTRP